jgi:tRNA dimethylallyltransferase
VAHWLIDILDPPEAYSAYRFASDALGVIRDAARRGRTVLICGGTGLYLKRLAEGIGPQIAMNPAVAQAYENRRLSEGADSIFEELASVDPETAARLHPNDTNRIVRALQVFHDTGIPLSVHKKNTCAPEDVEFFTVILTLPRPELYGRINARVDTMVKSGLWDEFRLLRQKGYGRGDAGMQSVGYQELFDVEDGRCSLAQAAETIKMNSRRYAKRQITWFNHQTPGIAVDMAQADCAQQIERSFTRALQEQ